MIVLFRVQCFVHVCVCVCLFSLVFWDARKIQIIHKHIMSHLKESQIEIVGRTHKRMGQSKIVVCTLAPPLNRLV